MKLTKTLFALTLLILFSKAIQSQNSTTKAYNNYDFIPGESILFEDNFVDAPDGEFPPRWNLLSGQGVVNKVSGLSTFVYTDGSLGTIAKIEPAMKTKTYLGNAFTIEFDFYVPSEEEVFEIGRAHV